MEGKTKQIFRIIASLSPSEKAYFKKFGFKSASKENDEFILFDLIDKNLKKIHFNESHIITRFKKKRPNKNYNLIKSRLVYRLLNSLVEYDKKNNKTSKIYDLILIAESLKERQLYQDSYNVLLKADNLAVELEQYELSLFIKRKSIAYFNYISKFKKQEEIEIIIKEYRNTLNKIEEQVAVDAYIQEIVFFQKNIGVPRNTEDFEAFNKIKEHSYFAKDYFPHKYANVIDLSIAKSCILQMDGRADLALEICEKAINYKLTSNELMIEYEMKLVSLYDTLLQSALLTFDLKTFEDYYNQFIHLNIEKNHVLNFRNSVSLYSKSMYAIIGNKLHYINEIVSEFNAQSNSLNLPNFRKVSLAYYTILGSFFQKNYDTCHRQIVWLKNNRQLGIRFDVEIGLYALEAILLFYNEEIDLLTNQMRSFYDFLKSKNRKFKMETAVMKMLKKLMRATINDSKSIFKESLHIMQKIIDENPNERLFLNSFDCITWLESNLYERDFYKSYYKKNILPNII